MNPLLRIDIITGFPKLLRGPFGESMLRQAKRKKLVALRVHDLRRFAEDRHRTIDDTPYGGGAGMILKPDPVFRCVESLARRRPYDEVIYLTADGETFTQQIANELSLKKNLLFICGHYKGIDERIRTALVTRELSIGDYVLTGGEVAAIVVADAVIRLLPGVLGDGESLLTDSFQDGLLDAPSYTRPAVYRGMTVPEVLLSGDHRAISEWRQAERLRKTRARRTNVK